MNSAIVLLSGGLDSVVSLALIKESCDNILALTFDYGQKSFLQEKSSSEKICSYYNISHKIVELDWLSRISNSSLNIDESIPLVSVSSLDNLDVTNKASKSVWVPNRNALFINIAACFAESYNYNFIVIGANKEEACTFKDNSNEFILAINDSIRQSTNIDLKVIAPLITMTKEEIVYKALNLDVPFDLLYSCYQGGSIHCGCCESCNRLKRALAQNNRFDIINKLFK